MQKSLPSIAFGAVLILSSPVVAEKMSSCVLPSGYTGSLQLEQFPKKMDDLPLSKERANKFSDFILPTLFCVNEQIRYNRHRIRGLNTALIEGEQISRGDIGWLLDVSQKYGVPKDKNGRIYMKELISRVDIIPLSLALSIAAKESGWGSSRFSQVNNAHFGQMTRSKTNSVKSKHPDMLKAGLRVQVFSSIYESAEAFALNLNTHPAYKDFRSVRKQQRSAGRLNTIIMTKTLEAYCGCGPNYTKELAHIIDQYNLQKYDNGNSLTKIKTVLAKHTL